GVWVSRRASGDFDDLRVQQVRFLLGGDRASAWQDMGARDRIAASPALYLARDEGPKSLAFSESQDHPVIARPLPDTATSFWRKAKAGLNTEPGRHYLAGTPARPVMFEDLTVQAWVHRTEDQEHPLVLVQTREQASGQPGRSLGLWLNPTGNLRLSLGSRPGGTSAADLLAHDLTSTATVPKARWTHVACVYQSDKVTLIVDGVAEDHPFSRPSDGSMELGRIDVGSNPTQRFQGQLKALWIHTQADAPARIAARRYSLPDPSQQPSLVGLWCFPAPPASSRIVSSMASVPFDLVRGGLPGERSPAVAKAPAPTNYFREGRSALTLTSTVQPGVNAMVAHGPGPHRRRCVEVWFRAEDMEALDRPQVIYHEGNSELGSIIYLDTGRIYFGTYNAERGNPDGVWISSHRVRPKRWHHAALLLDGRAELRPDTFCAMLDGKLIDRGRATDLGAGDLRAHIGASAPTVRFHSGPGKASASHAFVGQIAEVRVWSSKRTPTEIAQDAQVDPATVRGRALAASTGLGLWLDFDRVDAGHLVDLSVGAADIAVDPAAVGPMNVGIDGLRVPGAGASLDLRDLTGIATIREMQSDSRFGFARLTSLWHELPHTGRRSGESFYDQTFNDRRVSSAVWPYAFDTPQLWTINSSAEADVEVADRLSAALSVPKKSLAELVTIVEGTQRDRVFVDRALLMALYREIHLARLLKVSVREVQELKRLLKGAQAPGAQRVLDLYAAQAQLTKAGVKVPEAKLLHDTPAVLLADPSVLAAVEAQLDKAAADMAQAVGSIDGGSLACPELSQKAAADAADGLSEAGLLTRVQLQQAQDAPSTGLVAPS
ncbi:MAG: LamG domain-containing protein, partial [Myxococcales bacterium]|nr:LamG domain-containing protein [Myxococcales bacterium]